MLNIYFRCFKEMFHFCLLSLLYLFKCMFINFFVVNKISMKFKFAWEWAEEEERKERSGSWGSLSDALPVSEWKTNSVAHVAICLHIYTRRAKGSNIFDYPTYVAIKEILEMKELDGERTKMYVPGVRDRVLDRGADADADSDILPCCRS